MVYVFMFLCVGAKKMEEGYNKVLGDQYSPLYICIYYNIYSAEYAYPSPPALKRCDLVSIHTLFSVVSSGGLVRRAVAANSELGQVCSVYLQRKTMVRMHTYVSLRVLLAFGAFSPLFSLHRHSMVINRNISLLACSCLMP